MSYLTWREYVRSGPICLGVLLIIAGAVMVLLPTLGITLVPEWDSIIGAILAVVGVLQLDEVKHRGIGCLLIVAAAIIAILIISFMPIFSVSSF